MCKLSTLNICFLAGTLGQGGAERQLYYLLKSLKENGATVRLLCLTQGEFWEQPIRELGVPVIWVGQSSDRIVRLFQILLELKKSPPDIFQSQHFYTNLYVSLIARFLGSKEIGAIRNDGEKDLLTTDYVGGQLCLHLPKLLAVNSENAISNLRKNKGIARRKLFLLPNIVDLDKFAPPNSVECENEGVVHILSIGRLDHQKRFDRLLRMSHELRKTCNHGFEIEILGDGPDRSHLEKMAADMKKCRQKVN
jgi:glycosyltransferase involved in cell wall biosynthesis